MKWTKPILPEPVLAWNDVIIAIEQKSGILLHHLMEKKLSPSHVHWRRMAMWLLWCRTTLSLGDIARSMACSERTVRKGIIDICRQNGWGPIGYLRWPPSMTSFREAGAELLTMTAALAGPSSSHPSINSPEETNRHMTKSGPMTDERKEALAQGREDGRIVRRYLEALEDKKPRRGRPVDVETTRRHIADVDAQLAAGVDPLKRLRLVQRKIDLSAAVETKSDTGPSIEDLEADFVKAAAGYAERKGIAYQVWRSAGVPAEVLKRAGITR